MGKVDVFCLYRAFCLVSLALNVSQVFEGQKMVGHFSGHNAQNDARRHAFVTSQASYEKNGNPNGDTYSSQTN